MLPFAGPGDGWQTGRVTDDHTWTVRGDAELIARAGHLFDAVHEEFVLAARDLSTWSQPEIRSAMARRVHSPGKDGVTVRKMWSPLVLADEAQRAHLLRLGTAGTHVRISSAPLPHETSAISAMLIILAVVNAILIAWAMALDARHSSGLARVHGDDVAGPGERGLFAGHRRLGGGH